MFHIVERNVFAEDHWQILVDTLRRMGLDYEVVRYIPFEHQVEHVTPRKDIWVWGALNMAHICSKYGWKPGSMYNANHDFEVYGPKFGLENMLNGDAHFMNIEEEVPSHMEYFFARPTGDTKSIKSQVYSAKGWKDLVELSNSKHSDSPQSPKGARVMLSSPKDTQQEVRCWVVNGKVVTASRYKLGFRVNKQNYDNESMFVDFAQSMVDKYQPAEAFVIDVCLSENLLKVVEVNCINCSGFYHANMPKLVEAIENHFT
jgi:hypothetical protein